MAGVRDPQFWKRFSMAVHMDEENAAKGQDLKHSDSWLARQQKKKSRRTCICWAFWLGFSAFVATIVIVILYLKSKGVFDNIHIGNSSTATATATATSTATRTASTTATSVATATSTVVARRSQHLL